jgi:hypothetical protein
MAVRSEEQSKAKYPKVIERIEGYYEAKKCHSASSTSGIPAIC